MNVLNDIGLKQLVANIKAMFASKTHSHTKSQITDFPTIEDSLSSENTTDVLSAHQGKVLKDMLDLKILAQEEEPTEQNDGDYWLKTTTLE